MDMATLVGGVLLAAGVGIILYEKRLEARARASLGWPSAEGEITRSRWALGGSGGWGGGTNTYKADIHYKYRVGARTYRGHKVCIGFDVATGSKARAEERCARYPVGRTVPVYYNPNNPEEACLEQTADAPQVMYIIGGAFAAFGFVILTGIIQFH